MLPVYCPDTSPRRSSCLVFELARLRMLPYDAAESHAQVIGISFCDTAR